jgi:hypothetical protein
VKIALVIPKRGPESLRRMLKSSREEYRRDE